nr:basic helix-loop-helix transcription factor [Loropetalum chinense var. rubrum]
MDHLKHHAFCQPIQPSNPPITEFHHPPPDPRVPCNRQQSNSSQRPDAEVKDCTAARKVQKADREKLRRDRLNEQFIELGNALDPDRPKNDKATILADTIQLLKDLTAQVSKLKAEYVTLTEESRELTQEKNDLREEKASLKSDIESLNVQYQQRARAMYPWPAMDHSVVMGPPSYPFPVPMPIPPGPIPMHPSMQPYPFFGSQNPGPGSRSHISSKQDSRNKLSGESKIDKSEDSNDVATDLELKTPGSTGDQDSSSRQRKSKKLPRKENSVADGSSSSRCSSSPSVQDSSSNSVIGGAKADD